MLCEDGTGAIEYYYGKLGDLASYGADPRRIPYAGTEADGVTVDYQSKYNRQQQAIMDNYADFGVPYDGEDNIFMILTCIDWIIP